MAMAIVNQGSTKFCRYQDRLIDWQADLRVGTETGTLMAQRSLGRMGGGGKRRLDEGGSLSVLLGSGAQSQDFEDKIWKSKSGGGCSRRISVMRSSSEPVGIWAARPVQWQWG